MLAGVDYRINGHKWRPEPMKDESEVKTDEPDESEHLDLGTVTAALHDAKIHGSVSWFFDRVWQVQLTRDAAETVSSAQQAAKWLRATTSRLYPQSEIAKRFAWSENRNERGNNFRRISAPSSRLSTTERSTARCRGSIGAAPGRLRSAIRSTASMRRALSKARKKPPNGCGQTRSSITQIAHLRNGSRIH
jgi:hypothetical protein